VCHFCGMADHEEDPVDKAMGVCRTDGKAVTLAWFTGKPKHAEKNDGCVCYYCLATYQSRHKHRGVTMAQLLATLGSQQEEMDKFMAMRRAVIQFFVENGGREARVRWAEIDQKVLSYQEVHKSSYEDPVDEHWEYDLYVSEKGSPDTNKLGHTTTTVLGRKLVVVPGKRIWKVRRAVEQQVILKQVIDTGNQSVTPGQVNDKAAELTAMLQNFMPMATGAAGHDSLSSILHGMSAAASSSSVPAAAKVVPSTAMAGMIDQPLSLGLGMFGMQAPASSSFGGGAFGSSHLQVLTVRRH
jgi:hypothetical protein